MDLEILKAQGNGLIEKKKALRATEALFQKAKGIDETIASTQKENTVTCDQIVTLKAEIADLKNQKTKALSSTAESLAEKMGEVLPYGKAAFRIDDDGVFIGWDKTPYDGLSGGEKAMFDTALCHALKANIIVIEAAEVDQNSLKDLLEKLKDHESQIIINTCHPPAFEIDDNFKAVFLGGEA